MDLNLKLVLLLIVVPLVATLTHSRRCKFSTGHKLPQVVCSNFTLTEEDLNVEHENLQKLVFKNVTGHLDLFNLTLNHLHYLVISHSQIEEFSLGHYPELIFLTLLKNKKFPDLTQDLFQPPTHINWLSLVSNNHTIMPDAFHFLKNLTWLHIQNQKLELVTGELFKENTLLHELSLRNCHLRKIDGNAFHNLVDLEILSLNFNKLTHFESGTFHNLQKLKILELHHNKLTDLNLVQFQGLVSLEVLGLPSNFLKNITGHSLVEAFPNLQKVEMKKRDLMRNGDSKQLITQLRREGIDIIGTPHDCHNPVTHCNIN